MDLIAATIDPNASMDEANVPVAPSNPMGRPSLTRNTSVKQVAGVSSSSAQAGPVGNWFSQKVQQLQKKQWLVTGSSVIWLMLNLRSVLDMDLDPNNADNIKTVLDVLLNGPQMAQVVRDLSQFGLAVVLTIGGRFVGSNN